MRDLDGRDWWGNAREASLASQAWCATKVHTKDFDYKGHTHRASEDDPQYEIKSDKTDHIAAHKGSVLTLVDE